MPTFSPVSPDVSWPESEGVIGVVGVAPWATLEFLVSLYSQVSAERDWLFPRVIADVNSKIPSRGRHFELGETDPSPFIAATITELASSGATIAVVPCNTAHILFDRWTESSPIPVINMVDEVVFEVARCNIRSVITLASRTLHERQLYEQNASGHGITPILLKGHWQGIVSRLIDDIKVNGRIPPENLSIAERLADEIASTSTDAVILGCTELSVMGPILVERGLTVFDSNSVLAASALRRIAG